MLERAEKSLVQLSKINPQSDEVAFPKLANLVGQQSTSC